MTRLTTKTSTKKGRSGPEEQQQIAFFDYCNYMTLATKNMAYSLAFHIGNERKASIQRRIMMKRAGVKKGVPDICVPVPNDKYHALYIEMKIKPNRLSPEQADYLRHLNQCGNYAVVAWSADEAIEILEKYLHNKL